MIKAVTTTVPHRPARLRYGDNAFQILEQGAFVICAVTGRPIQLEDLRYWNAALQEPYSDAHAAEARYRQLTEGPNPQGP